LLEVPDKRIGMISLKQKYFDIVIEAKDRMVRRGKWKLTYQPLTDGTIYRLFDIERDPGCTDDVIGRFPEVATELRHLLDKWMANDPRSIRPAPSRSHPATAVADVATFDGAEAAIGKAS